MENKIRISVIMGVYNSEQTVAKAINSIITQSYENWEFIICDDCSTDNTWNILESYQNNPKIKLIRNDHNLGLAETLNKCIKEANGYYLARQDADDYSLPERFLIQINHLAQNPQIDVLGTFANAIDEKNESWGVITVPIVPTAKDWIRGVSIIHPSVMMKREAVISSGAYNKKAKRVEDYDLWLSMVSDGRVFMTLPKVLYHYQLSYRDYQKKAFKYRIHESLCRLRGYKKMKASFFSYVYVFKPIILAIIPKKILAIFHRWYFSNR